MSELLQLFDELETQGWVCLLKWDGERQSRTKAVAVSKAGKQFRGDYTNFEQALIELRIWLQELPKKSN